MNNPYGKHMHFFDISINNGRICMGFVADNSEKVQKHTNLIWFSSKNFIQKLLKIK